MPAGHSGHFSERGSSRDRAGAAHFKRDSGEHEAKPRVCFYLQLPRRPVGSRNALPIHRMAALANDCGACDELKFRVRHYQCSEVTRNATSIKIFRPASDRRAWIAEQASFNLSAASLGARCRLLLNERYGFKQGNAE
jgi:hypothetical protein